MASRVTGLIRNIVLAAALPVVAGGAADAFAVANALPNTVFNLISSGLLAGVIVPQIVKAVKTHDDRGDAFVSKLLTLGVLALLVVTAVAVVPASVVAIIGRTGAPLPGGCIGGGLELRGSRGLEHKLALIIGVYVRVELAERDRRGDHAERGDERVVVDAKASKYVGN
jgi:hypothetical protein